MKKILCMTMLMLAALTASAMAQTKAASPPEQDIGYQQAATLSLDGMTVTTATPAAEVGIGPRTAGEPRAENPCALIELKQQPHRLSYPRCGC